MSRTGKVVGECRGSFTAKRIDRNFVQQLQTAQPSTPKINQADLMALTLTRYARQRHRQHVTSGKDQHSCRRAKGTS
jgi:hypothetical protein